MEKSLESLLISLKKINIDKELKDPENGQVLKLAFIGDTIFDMFTRDYLISNYNDKIKMNEMHKKNVSFVCAKSQARIVEKLIDDGTLTEEEIEFYRHARNAHPHSKSKNSSIVDYRKATGFEALFGLLFYKNDVKRLIEILEKIKLILE